MDRQHWRWKINDDRKDCSAHLFYDHISKPTHVEIIVIFANKSFTYQKYEIQEN